MYIVTAIPLDYIPKEAGETFSFFSVQLLTKGSLIEANIKKRLVKLLITEINPLKDYKASLRKSDFALSPVSKVLWETPFLQDIHYEIARYLSSYYNESLGSYLKLIFPLKIWKQLKKLELALPNLKNNNSNKAEINIDYVNNNIINQSFKGLLDNNDGQLLIVCPTLTHLQYLEEQIKNVAPSIPLLVYRKDLGMKDLVTFYKKFVEYPNAIILGLQSAIFLPFFNLKSIVIYDYKHRGQFSIDQHPYFTTTKVAAMWSKLTGCKLIVTAILPDTEIIKLSSQYLEDLPQLKKQELEIVDLKTMSVEMKAKIILAPNVLNQVKKALTQNKKVLIFLNRKGLAHYIICKDCGQVPHCPHCQKPLTLREHGAGRELICRSCGYKTVVPNVCPNCNSWHLKEVGLGVEAIEKQLKDNAVSEKDINLISKDELENGITLIDLLSKKYSITIATEIIFKPQTIPFDLTVVVNIDNLLNSTNYLASEELINCLAEIKELSKEKIILQTFEPTNELWDYLGSKSLEHFYKEELKNRETYHYPPFTHIVRLNFWHKNNLLGIKKANQLFATLQDKINKLPLAKRNLINVLGPISDGYHSKQGVFFWEIIIKLDTDSSTLRNTLLQGLAERNINLEIDPPLGI